MKLSIHKISSGEKEDFEEEINDIDSSVRVSTHHLFASKEEETSVIDEMKANPMIKRKVLWKVDLFICTNLFLIAFLEFLDKNALGIAAVYNLKEDAGLVGNQYSTLASVFYFGYLLGEFICFFVIPKVKIGKFVSVALGIWGGLLICMAACNSFGSLVTVRFLLGIFEAAILPSFIIISSMWWTKAEQPLRSTLYFNTLAGILGGIFGHCIGLIDGKLATWKYLFIIYGSVTVFYSFFLFFSLPDNIESAWFLNKKEKQIAYLRVVKNQTGVVHQKSSYKLSHVIEALKDPKYWIVVAFIICQSICNAGVTNFNPLIIKSFGFSALKTTLMASPQAAVAMGGGIIVTALCMWIENIRCLLWVLSTLPALVGSIMVNKIKPTENRQAALAGVYLMGFYNVPWCLMLALTSSNMTGSTKKTFMSVSVAVWYAVGNIIGPYFFKSSQAPYYPMGIHAMEASFCIMAFTGILYYIAIRYQNRQKDQYLLSQEIDVDIVQDDINKDLTDFENPHFKYVY